MINYCSIACYKSPDHVSRHEQVTTEKSQSQSQDQQQHQQHQQQDQQQDQSQSLDHKFDKIIENKSIQDLLKLDALQIHLSSLIKLSQSFNSSEKYDLLNMKINDMRLNGIEENQLVEEFIHTFLLLLNEELWP